MALLTLTFCSTPKFRGTKSTDAGISTVRTTDLVLYEGDFSLVVVPPARVEKLN